MHAGRAPGRPKPARIPSGDRPAYPPDGGLTLATAWLLLKDAAMAWHDDYAPSMGAALAYYTIFSAAPLLLIVVSVAGLVFGPEAARGEIFTQLHGLIGEEGALAVQALLQSVSKPAEGALATVVGTAVVLVWVYYSAQIFLLGAEFTWVYAHRCGSRRGEPRPGVVPELPADPSRQTSATAPIRRAVP